ncbi:MAG: flavodoxin domain-containing protein [Butyricicoccus sp.]|nr:flavodoxin domain-containing protein [Butyricicoccus sp.]
MRNDILIVYKSETGFTREYAAAAAERLDCCCLPLKDALPLAVPVGGTLVFGGRLHAGRLDGLRNGLKLFRASKAKRLVVFATGATPADAEDTIRGMWESNLGHGLLECVPHFYLPAGLRYDKMGTADRLMMGALKGYLRRKRNKSESDLAMERMISDSFDIYDTEYLEPMLKLLGAGAEA